jgi:quercetin dioxygenase-like cupin family protein
VVEWLGVVYKTILRPGESEGRMSIVDVHSLVGSGPPRHIHHNEDEVLILLSGEYEFWLEGETFPKGSGETVFVPRGKEHTYRVTGNIPSRHLTIFMPGGFEAFFADMARGQYRIPQNMPAIEEFAKRYNLTFTGPPLGAE